MAGEDQSSDLSAELRAALLREHRTGEELRTRTERLEGALAREQELLEELGALGRALAVRDEQLADIRRRTAEAERQSLRLAEYSRRLHASRAYRVVRWSWRARAALRFLLRRSG